MNETHPFKLAGVMGWPVAHSRSPKLHGFWLAHYGIAGTYVPLPVAPGRVADALKGLSALGFSGCNVTIPHKLEVMKLVDNVDPLAQRIGAVNTVVVEKDGKLSGFNTDGYGFVESVRDVRKDWKANAGPVVVLGAGGGARAIVVTLIAEGAKEIRLLNRTRERAEELASAAGSNVRVLAWDKRAEALDGAALLVNTTSQGMVGQPPLDIALDALPTTALVSDIVYNPLVTPLLASAKARGNTVVDGLGMLLHQARPAFRAFYGVMPEVTAELRKEIEDTL
ncbi:MAG: shikimate dehydrogenase [Pseudorhodoplanes sp.]|jgi:shikimate dehydrogenase|nr:shikimate dehydrogenase [Pseudorhodoplanes sp.]